MAYHPLRFAKTEDIARPILIALMETTVSFPILTIPNAEQNPPRTQQVVHAKPITDLNVHLIMTAVTLDLIATPITTDNANSLRWEVVSVRIPVAIV